MSADRRKLEPENRKLYDRIKAQEREAKKPKPRPWPFMVQEQKEKR